MCAVCAHGTCQYSYKCCDVVISPHALACRTIHRLLVSTFNLLTITQSSYADSQSLFTPCNYNTQCFHYLDSVQVTACSNQQSVAQVRIKAALGQKLALMLPFSNGISFPLLPESNSGIFLQAFFLRCADVKDRKIM